MKKLFAITLAVMMLLSCMVIAPAADGSRVMITACDALEGWGNDDKPFAESNIPEPTINTEIDPDGYGVVAFNYAGPVHGNGGWGRDDVSSAMGVKIAYWVAKDTNGGVASYDLVGMNYMIFDMYISNAAAVKDVEFWIELTSAGKPDNEERGWKKKLSDLKGSALVDGWNHFEIALDSNTNATGGELNLAAWNFVRFHNASGFDAGEGLTLAFKNLYFSESSPQAEAAAAAAEAIIALYAPLADITNDDITADNYDTIKAQLEAASAAYSAADGATQTAVDAVYEASKIERTVSRALEKYEDKMAQANQPADEPTDEPTDDPVQEPTDEPTEEPTDEPADDSAAKSTPGVGIIIAIVAVVAVVAVIVVVVIVVAKKKK